MKTRQKRKMKMKKLIMFSVAFALAFVSQAAQLDWGLQSKSVTMKSGGNAAGVTAYLLAFADSVAADGYYSSLKEGTVKVSDATGAALDNATTATGKSWGAINKTTTSPSLTEGALGYYALLFTEKVDGKDYFMLSALSQGQAYDPSGSVETEGMKATFDAGSFGAAESRTGWTAAAPEPTSGLLMLIGLGALALRRRRA